MCMRRMPPLKKQRKAAASPQDCAAIAAHLITFMPMLIRNAKALVQVRQPDDTLIKGEDLARLPLLENAWLKIANGLIEDFGPEPYSGSTDGLEQIDASGCYVMPGFVDCHTHIVFSHSREGEFVDRIKGLSYEEIAERGGGILNSARRLQATSEDELYASALERSHEVMRMGTVALEIKSGYGLTVQDEIKMLRVVKRLREALPIPVKATFLGAHAIPQDYKPRRQEYIDLIINEMLPQVAAEGLADYCDVFCDKGFFTPEETAAILQAGLSHGIKPRIHANELAISGGVQVGVQYGALSVDHLEMVGDEEITLLAQSKTLPVLLPGTAFFLSLVPPPARKMITAGLPVVLASDYNPGSCPSGNMPFVLSLACTLLKMTPAEAINAATVNAAAALELQQSHGSITRGKAASLIITEPLTSIEALPYFYGRPHIRQVIINGQLV